MQWRNMVRERSDRIDIEIEAEIIFSVHLRYMALIVNFSNEGLSVVVTAQNESDFSWGSKFDLEFETPTGELLKIHCEVMRSHKISHDEMIYNLGLKIIENSPEYDEFFKTLFMNRLGML
jgi:hypothetical protein